MRLLDGRVLKDADLRGKVVLVQFWATWCPACVEEMPDLGRFHARYRDKGFEMIAVSLDESEKPVRAYLKANGFQFPAAMMDKAHLRAYGPVLATPTFLLFDKRGVLVQKVVGPLDLAKLQGVLGRLL